MSNDTKDDELKRILSTFQSFTLSCGYPMNQKAHEEYIKSAHDAISKLMLQERKDELRKLPDCNIESLYHGSTDVVLVKSIIKRSMDLDAALKEYSFKEKDNG